MSEPVKTFNIAVLLLVEDDDNDIIITKRKILRSSLQVSELVIVKDLAECKAELLKKQINVVLLDLNLPDSKGLKTYNEVRAVYNGVIIILTSINDELLGVDAIRRGADDYLIKNQLTEARLSQSIIFSIERRDSRDRVAQLKEDIQTLQKVIKA